MNEISESANEEKLNEEPIALGIKQLTDEINNTSLASRDLVVQALSAANASNSAYDLVTNRAISNEINNVSSLLEKHLSEQAHAMALAKSSVADLLSQRTAFNEISSASFLAEKRLFEQACALDVAKSSVADLLSSRIPFDEINNASFLAEKYLSEQAHAMALARKSVIDSVSNYRENFYLPSKQDISALMDSAYIHKATAFQDYLSQSKQAMEAMRSPWLDIQQAALSIKSFSEIQYIGHTLKDISAYEDSFTKTLRVDLGDWRDLVTWPEAIFTDTVARKEFYFEQGFNPALTNFPAPAFQQSLSLAELDTQPPSLIDIYGSPFSSSHDGATEEGFIRTNNAHDWLQRFETNIRCFIDKVMTKEFGANWEKHRLPNGLYDTWQEKKLKLEKETGKEFPLISYADFTDYSLIICRQDNWKAVFIHFFHRIESIRESFQRMYPIRICTMHARPITQDDELILFTEIKRIRVTIESFLS